MATEMDLIPGSLWDVMRNRSADALRCGALQPISTTSETIEQDGIAFEVRLVRVLEQKAQAQAPPLKVNPFLPYDQELFVGNLSRTHFALLNKYNVLDHHLLIVTRVFEDHETVLTQPDCEALLRSLAEVDGLVFYNAGPTAGAGQPHKHLQLIPLSTADGPRLPIEPLLIQAKGSGPVPGLPFLHAYAPINPDWLTAGREGAEALRTCYRSLLETAQLSVESAIGGLERTGPYNLLATRRWIMLIPRSKEFFEGISINALGLAGFLLAKTAAQIDTLRTSGPMAALRHVTHPPTAR